MRLNIYHLVALQGCTGLAVMVFGPVWALLADRKVLRRKTLLVMGFAGWGLTSILMAMLAHDFQGLLLLRFVRTAFLCSGAPIAQSIIGGSVSPELQGRCFSWLALSGGLAVILTSHLSTAISEQPMLGFAGWRFGLLSMGLLSLALSFVTLLTMQEPSGKCAIDDFLPGSVNFLVALRNLKDHWQLRSFRLLCLLGSCCSFSWQVMLFSTLYFQYRGLTDWQAGFATSCGYIGDLVATLFGGALSDALHRRYSLHGRLYLAQASLACTLPVVLGIFVTLPRHGVVSASPYAVLMFLFGLSVGSCVSAVNKPLLSQIAPASHSASIVAWEQTLESTIGTMWAPAAILGLQRIAGYHASHVAIPQMSMGLRDHNANALAFVIFSFMAVAYVCAVAGYTALHWTLSHDLAERASGCKKAHAIEKAHATEKTSLLSA